MKAFSWALFQRPFVWPPRRPATTFGIRSLSGVSVISASRMIPSVRRSDCGDHVRVLAVVGRERRAARRSRRPLLTNRRSISSRSSASSIDGQIHASASSSRSSPASSVQGRRLGRVGVCPASVADVEGVGAERVADRPPGSRPGCAPRSRRWSASARSSVSRGHRVAGLVGEHECVRGLDRDPRDRLAAPLPVREAAVVVLQRRQSRRCHGRRWRRVRRRLGRPAASKASRTSRSAAIAMIREA